MGAGRGEPGWSHLVTNLCLRGCGAHHLGTRSRSCCVSINGKGQRPSGLRGTGLGQGCPEATASVHPAPRPTPALSASRTSPSSGQRQTPAEKPWVRRAPPARLAGPWTQTSNGSSGSQVTCEQQTAECGTKWSQHRSSLRVKQDGCFEAMPIFKVTNTFIDIDVLCAKLGLL